ncbi:MAG: helix-turn-helix domain-containing protein [Limisphaerales bacterium]
MKTTKFSDVAQAAAYLAEDPGMEQALRNEIQAGELLSTLISMRVSKGLTQENVAASMHCDSSTVSRMESGSGRELKWSDILGYLAAMPAVHMSIMFDDQSLPPETRIKQCVFQIDADLQRLAQMAQQFDGDEQISGKVNQFYKEVLFNFLARFLKNREKLSNFISVGPQKEPTALPDRTAAEQRAAASPPSKG